MIIEFGHISSKKDESCTIELNISAPAAVLNSQSIVLAGLAFMYFNLSLQRFLVCGEM
jgi:hypothetical protein